MLVADRILRIPLLGSVLGVVGAVMGVLKIARGVDAAVEALQLLGFATRAVS
jgi:hypothetical protein